MLEAKELVTKLKPPRLYDVLCGPPSRYNGSWLVGVPYVVGSIPLVPVLEPARFVMRSPPFVSRPEPAAIWSKAY